jgi:hypothetical protein
MKTALIILAALFSGSVLAQGTFQNLNFESADVSGYSPSSQNVPTSSALPGWTAYYGTTPTSTAWYDGISLGGAIISVIDNKAPSFAPLQGNYSAFLFGGPYQGQANDSVSIRQSGIVPGGTQSLLFEGYVSGAPFTVTLGGQTIAMIPLQNFPGSGFIPPYTLYGGNIPSAFEGQSETLAFTELAPSPQQFPSMLELDGISFSPQTVPEPSPLALTGVGGLLFALYRRFAPKRP